MGQLRIFRLDTYWVVLDRDHSNSLLGANEALKVSTLRTSSSLWENSSMSSFYASILLDDEIFILM